jgi:hypothetical protein
MKHIGEHWDMGLTMDSWRVNRCETAMTRDLRNEHWDGSLEVVQNDGNLEVTRGIANKANRESRISDGLGIPPQPTRQDLKYDNTWCNPEAEAPASSK